ncbi:target of EGR1 protein 1 [Octopus bimaculoides]|uniref:Target of EGR1 protein 1 n=1 Tax=Octopus bimaculoides TaxID=37653 RepID=A0A0L8GG04_OCTBM|nr:target of EGR1 protein 1 [Octopus bimaculoides]|eukprot:XP_014781393.1 PREDICTED: target of EGR1 protein 1-like [Octopus bimaculoides]
METTTDHNSSTSPDYTVPIINVHADNFKSLWPSILLAIRGSTFLALDTEMSGLGDRKSLLAKCVEERYKAMSSAARSRSVLSFGLSCFKLQQVETVDQTDKKNRGSEEEVHGTKKVKEWKYVVQNYDIALLCFDEYVVEPRSMQFLIDHGFDFNRQFSKGSQYYRGNDRDHHDISRPSVRDLFNEILLSNVPIVLHNGIIDLVFLHQNFYCDLPLKFNTFVSNLSEMFSAGIFDTKYLIEYVMRMSASYLLYVFKKCVRDNNKSSIHVNDSFVSTSFFNYQNKCSDVTYSYFGWQKRNSSDITQKLSKTACEMFAAHGWCRSGRKCTKSHDVDLILDLDEHNLLKIEVKKKRKRERKQKKRLASVLLATKNMASDEEDASPAKHVRPSDGGNREGLSDASDCDNGSSRVSEELSNGSSSHTMDIDDMVTTTAVTTTSTTTSLTSTTTTAATTTSNNPHHQINGELEESLQHDSRQSSPDMLEEIKAITDSLTSSAVPKDEKLGSSHSMESTKNTKSAPCGHSSGFDAFMTGFIFSVAVAKFGEVDVKDCKLVLTGGQIRHWLNKVFLSNKDVPLSVCKSKFSQCSNFHRDKYRSLRSNSKT